MLNKKLFREFGLIITSTILIVMSLFTYNRSNVPVIPNCHAKIITEISNDNSRFSGSYLFSIMPNRNTPNHASILMNGELNIDKKKYTVSRKFLINYELQGNHFFLQVESMFISPSDQVGDKFYIRGVPQVNQIYLVEIKKSNENHYVFQENFHPFFVCEI